MTGFEPLIIAAAGGVAGVATETFVEKGGWLAKTLKQGVGEKTKEVSYCGISD